MAPQHRSDTISPVTSFGASMPVWVAEDIFAAPKTAYTQALFAAAFDLQGDSVADPIPA